MIIPDSEALARLNSSENLLNRLAKASERKSVTSLDLFINKTKELEKVSDEIEESKAEPKLDDLMRDGLDQIKKKTAESKAEELLEKVIDEIDLRLTEVKADKLPSILGAVGKFITDSRKEANEAAKSRDQKNVHLHFYSPQQKAIEEYDVIDVG